MSEPRRPRVAVVDDDPAIRDVVCDILLTGGMDSERFGCAADLFSQLSPDHGFDLIILDLQLPDLDGFSVAARIRVSSSVPIIMLSGRGAELDRVMGLEIGADDYVVKPFSVRELLARVKAIRRRARGDFAHERPVRKGYRFHGYVMDTERRRLNAPAGTQIALTVAEFDLLHAMVERHGRVLSRDQLLEITHRAGDDIFDRTIDVLILRLRRKIEPTPTSPQFIKTERGHGYVFSALVEAI